VVKLQAIQKPTDIIIGSMLARSDAFQSMFSALQRTALGRKHGAIMATKSATGLYTSTQFSRTVSLNEPNDNFLRPCHWLLWSRISKTGLLVSPEEANLLIPILREASLYETICHLIVYAAPITSRMLQFNNLDYFAIPPLPKGFVAPTWLKVELGIFAGRLYFEWDEYNELMSYLNTQVLDDEGEEDTQVVSQEASAMKPLAFLHEWLAIRRKGQDFEHTPMGYITTGKPLSADHPFFSIREQESVFKAKLSVATAHEMQIEDDDNEESDDGEDDAKEYLFPHDNRDDEDIFYDAENDFDGKENMFFDSKVYIDREEEK